MLFAGSGAACSMPPDHDVGRGSPEPDLSAPHHLPEMDTDTARYNKIVFKHKRRFNYDHGINVPLLLDYGVQFSS